MIIRLEIRLDVTLLLTLLQPHVQKIEAAFDVLILKIGICLFESFDTHLEECVEGSMHVRVIHCVRNEDTETRCDLNFNLTGLLILQLLQKVLEQIRLELE